MMATVVRRADRGQHPLIRRDVGLPQTDIHRWRTTVHPIRDTGLWVREALKDPYFQQSGNQW